MVSNFPARPTNGSPSRSSSAPGPSPTKTSSAFGTLRSGVTRARIAYFNLAVLLGVTVLATKALIGPTIKLETEMINVRKRTKASKEEIALLQQEFIDLSRVMPQTAEELAALGAVAGQLGIRGSKNILEFARVTAMMGSATVLTTEEAALALGKLSQAFDIPMLFVITSNFISKKVHSAQSFTQ